MEVPSWRARRSADCALRLLAELDLEPTQLLPSLEGGVCIAFDLDGHHADIQILNGGEIVTTCSEGPGTAPLVLATGCDLATASRTIWSFFFAGALSLNNGPHPADLARC